MADASATGGEIKVADEVFIATALLHKEGASGYLVAAGARSRPPQWK